MKELEAALVAKFEADTGAGGLMIFVTGVYNTVADDEAEHPFLVFRKVSGVPSYTFTQRIRDRYLYDVEIVGQGMSKATLLDALARLDALLTDQELVVSGKTTWVVRRLSDLPDSVGMDDDGNVLMRVGAQYAIELA